MKKKTLFQARSGGFYPQNRVRLKRTQAYRSGGRTYTVHFVRSTFANFCTLVVVPPYACTFGTFYVTYGNRVHFAPSVRFDLGAGWQSLGRKISQIAWRNTAILCHPILVIYEDRNGWGITDFFVTFWIQSSCSAEAVCEISFMTFRGQVACFNRSM